MYNIQKEILLRWKIEDIKQLRKRADDAIKNLKKALDNGNEPYETCKEYTMCIETIQIVEKEIKEEIKNDKHTNEKQGKLIHLKGTTDKTTT